MSYNNNQNMYTGNYNSIIIIFDPDIYIRICASFTAFIFKMVFINQKLVRAKTSCHKYFNFVILICINYDIRNILFIVLYST